jgi:uncharacterized phage-associated protein
MRPAAPTSFDVAIWFLDRARAEDTYLQPRKLQCLLFLAQAHFAAAYEGRVLMPSFFVMDDAGPFDPNLYRALENGRPEVSEKPLEDNIVAFLSAVWRRYRDADALRLDQLISRQGANEDAICARDCSEVTIAAMQRMFSRGGEKPGAVPAEAQTHTGRKVTLQKWTPKRRLTAR